MLGIKQQRTQRRSLSVWSLPSPSRKTQKITTIIKKNKQTQDSKTLEETKRIRKAKTLGQECSADVTFNLGPEGVGSMQTDGKHAAQNREL